VFVTPTRLQLAIFAKILKIGGEVAGSSTAESLALIGLLTKVCHQMQSFCFLRWSSPYTRSAIVLFCWKLLWTRTVRMRRAWHPGMGISPLEGQMLMGNPLGQVYRKQRHWFQTTLVQMICRSAVSGCRTSKARQRNWCLLPGKMILLDKMLSSIYRNTEEKCVLVSHYTSTLNILEAYCDRKNYRFFRLDGYASF